MLHLKNYLKLSQITLLLTFTTLLSAQNKWSFSTSLQGGFAGAKSNKIQIVDGRNIHHSSHQVFDFSTGVEANYYFSSKKRWSVSSGLIYNTTFLNRKVDSNPTGFTLELSRSQNDKFRTHSLVVPIRFNAHLKKWQISVGILPQYHVSTKLKNEITTWRAAGQWEIGDSVFFAGDPVRFQKTYTVKDGDVRTLNSGDTESFYLEKKMTIQYSFGIAYQITKRFQVYAEIKDYLTKNLFYGVTDEANLSGNYNINRFQPFTDNMISSIGLRYFVFSGN